MDPQVGQLISNKYRLVRLIGDGGMGSVFEARHELLGTTVALKFLHSALARRTGLVERFLQEAQVSARIKSKHVASVSDVDRTPEGLAYMVMEYVEGTTLQMLYEKLYQAGERLSYGDAFDIMLQMVEGVTAAHELGIVHRDLKPDNVMLSPLPSGKPGRLVKLLDFGIAKLKASGEVDRGLTRPGVVMGTPEYMAPEQAFSADRVDRRADVFSLGVMFFEMLAGRRPVGGDNAHAIAAQYLEGTIASLTDLAPSIDAELAAAVHRAMEAKPETRFDTVGDLKRAIEKFSPAGSSSTPEPVSDEPAASDEVATPQRNVPKTLPPEQTYALPAALAATAPRPRGIAATANDMAAIDEAAMEPPSEPDGDETDEEVAAAQTADGEDIEAPQSDAETDSDGEPASADEAPDSDTDLDLPREPTNAARAEAEAVRGGTEAIARVETDDDEAASGDAVAQNPLRAGTEPMPPGALAAQGLGDGPQVGTADMQPMGDAPAIGATVTGGTQIGDDFRGPQIQADPDPQPAEHNPYGAPLVPPVGMPPAPAQGSRPVNSGPSLLGIVAIAALIATLVVGGVYGAHLASQEEDTEDDPIDSPQPTMTVADEEVDDDGPSEPPPVAEPPTPVVQPLPQPPPQPQPPPKPQPPKPQPPPQPQPPKPQPPPVLVLPSALPFTLPIPVPGFGKTPKPQPPPSQPPPSQPPPQPPATKPKFKLPKLGKKQGPSQPKPVPKFRLPIGK